MTEDYILEDEPYIEILDDNDSIIDEAGDLITEMDEAIEEADETIDELDNLIEGYRKAIPRFPLDHKVKCKYCEWTGIVGIRVRYCINCSNPLIPPEEVESMSMKLLWFSV